MDRRRFLALAGGILALPRPVRAWPAVAPLRRLRLVNAHTRETFDGPFRDDIGPIAVALAELSEFLRDHHSGEKTAIDVGVLGFLAGVMDAVGETRATVLSAYRTPETNASLSKTHFGVAENSQHIYGRALDVHFGDKLEHAMKTARAMQRGGVGWYPQSSFMHMDTGPVRNWDLDHPKLVTLISGNRRTHFDKKGRMVGGGKARALGGNVRTASANSTPSDAKLVSGTSYHVDGKQQVVVLRGNGPVIVKGNGVSTVGDRLSRLRDVARQQFAARTR